MLRDYYLDDASIIHVMTRAAHSYRVSLRTSQQTSVSFLFQIVEFCLCVLKMFIYEGYILLRYMISHSLFCKIFIIFTVL